MNNDQITSILSIIIPYFFIALWVLIPVAIIWGIVLLVKKSKGKADTLHIVRAIAGILIAFAGFVTFVLSAMVGIIEPTTLNIIISIALLIIGLLIANSVAVTRFFNDLV